MSGDGKPKPKHGDVLKFDNKMGPVSHYGIYNKEDNTVIHKTGPGRTALLSGSGTSNQSQVKSENYDRVAKRYDSVTVHNRPSSRSYSPETRVRNALSREGETSYNLVTDSCETFVRECETGKKESDQVVSAVAKVVEVAKSGTFKVDLTPYVFGSKSSP